MEKTGIELIAIERKEQIEKHGRTIEKDVEINDFRELAIAAQALIQNDSEDEGLDYQFPFSWDKELVRRLCMKSYKERLIIAGALIAAEIDRLQNS